MADAMGYTEEGHLGTVVERTCLRQALEPRRDPAALEMSKTQRHVARHAQRRRQHDLPPGGVDPQRHPARTAAAHEGHRQLGAGMGNGNLLGVGDARRHTRIIRHR